MRKFMLYEPALPAATCPSCGDGGYGAAVASREYQCPACRAVWSPNPEGAVTSTRLGSWVQRLKVRATTYR